jgi:2,4-dienoyl-CoA reductase-like NADH-dependent reductase (Old Yellow Enzyme family)
MRLFEPIQIRHLEVKNRLAFAPTFMGHCSADGEVTDQALCHYSARAKGGVGLIIVEGTGVTRKYEYALNPRRGMLCCGEPYRKGLQELADAIHFAGARAVVQLTIGAGAQALFRLPPGDLVAPSPVPVRFDEDKRPRAFPSPGIEQGETPRALTGDEIAELVEAFVSAATMVQAVGFDGVEIHGAHGYLLAEFVSPLFNRREDEFGGSFEKRLTLPLRLIEAVRRAAGERFLIGYRMSGDEHVPGGLNREGSVEVARRLEEAGIDYLHLSSGCMQAAQWLFPDREGALLAEASSFKAALTIPVICPNIHDPETAEKALREQSADMASLCRALLVDPEWPLKAREQRADEIGRCVFCYQCLKTGRMGTGVRCSQNPELGWERFLPKHFPVPARQSR